MPTSVSRMHEERSRVRRPRLLVVDDEPEMVSSLCEIATIHGWEAQGAESGEAAIQRFDAVEFDAVVMDIRMPGINGVETFRLMHAVRPEVPVVLLTAHTAADLLQQARDAGVLDVMSKPVSVEVLFGTLEDAVDPNAT